MARPTTVARVHRAVLEMAAESGLAGLSMEGIAARAGAGKQTLYRTWPSTQAILLDALLARSLDTADEVAVPDTGDVKADLVLLLRSTIDELTDPVNDRLLRAVTAEVQTDEPLAMQVRQRLLDPQMRAIGRRLTRAGITDSDAGAELLMGPVLHRWLLRTGPFDDAWVLGHAARVLAALRG